MEKLARDPLLRRSMGKAGRMRIEQDFSIDRMVRDYQDLYLRKAGALLASRSGSLTWPTDIDGPRKESPEELI